MRRLILGPFLVVLLWFITASQAYATVACSLSSINPNPVTTNTQTVSLTIKVQGLIEGKGYTAQMSPASVGGEGIADMSSPLGTQTLFTVKNEVITINNVDSEGTINQLAQPNNYKNQTYTITITDPKTSSPYCSVNFTPQEANPNTCTITFSNKTFTTNDQIVAQISGISGNPNDQRRIILKNGEGKTLQQNCQTISNLGSEYQFGNLESGAYVVEVDDSCFALAFNPICKLGFTIGDNGGVSGSGSSGGIIPIPPPVCQNGVCKTAFGDISTDPSGFIKSIFGIILSLAGGIAIILIMIAGYRLMSSQGNPEKVQAAREQLTSAIVGLLFIIFSVTILQIIGVDILHIPGFTK